ncbi:gypsy retrotransposon integrase 1 [Labeo rohita]|uniref:Gypsy retrotransposon integrase 1 n=1 Tax=Labeo rohita TaxID=84645 RepID=A0A498MDJ7_LABRO|nr:gypsy retrotransposon integrase 1 [Labeo rohita]
MIRSSAYWRTQTVEGRVSIGHYQRLGRLYEMSDVDIHGRRDLDLALSTDAVVDISVVEATVSEEESVVRGKWSGVFGKDEDDLGCTEAIQHRIYTGDAPPIRERFRPLPPMMYKEMKLLLTGMLERGVITENNNPVAHLQTARLGAVEQRWVAQLASFDFTVKYRPGRENINADSLSRFPVDRVAPAEYRQVSVVEDGSQPMIDSLDIDEWSQEQGADEELQQVLRIRGYPSRTHILHHQLKIFIPLLCLPPLVSFSKAPGRVTSPLASMCWTSADGFGSVGHTVHSGSEEITYADPTFNKRKAQKTRVQEEDEVVYIGVAVRR